MPAAAGTARYENGAGWLETIGCHLCRASTPGFRPGFGVRGTLSPESTWPCEGRIREMKMVGRVASSIDWWSCPSPPLLDSSLRWNDERSGASLCRIGVQDMFS